MTLATKRMIARWCVFAAKHQNPYALPATIGSILHWTNKTFRESK